MQTTARRRHAGGAAAAGAAGTMAVPATSSSGLSEPWLDQQGKREAAEEVDPNAKSHSAASSTWRELLEKILLEWTLYLATFASSLQRYAFGACSVSGKTQLSEVQVDRLKELHTRIHVPFDGNNVHHQEALRMLWHKAWPDKECTALKTPQGGGFISLQNLLFLATFNPELFNRLLHKSNGSRSEAEYPFAVAGLNISFMLTDLLDLRDESRPPQTKAGRGFLALLETEADAFDKVYVEAFRLLDNIWLDMGASYMEFQAVLKATRAHLERVLLSRNLKTIADLQTALASLVQPRE
eukprot:jgi/Chlat1/8383/Chrsp80S07904